MSKLYACIYNLALVATKEGGATAVLQLISRRIDNHGCVKGVSKPYMITTFRKDARSELTECQSK